MKKKLKIKPGSKRDCVELGQHEWREPALEKRMAGSILPPARWTCLRCGFSECTESLRAKPPPPTPIHVGLPLDPDDVYEATTQPVVVAPVEVPGLVDGHTRRIRLRPTDTVQVLVRLNPRKPGTRAHAAYAEYRDGATVAELLATGRVTIGDLLWDIRHDNLAVGEV